MSHLSNVTGGSGTNKNRRMRYTLSVFTLFFLMKSRSHSNTHTQSADAMKNRINWIERIMFVVKFESHVKFNWERSSSQSCWVYCIGSTVDYHFIVSFRINTSIPSMFSHFALVSMLQLTLCVCVCIILIYDVQRYWKMLAINLLWKKLREDTNTLCKIMRWCCSLCENASRINLVAIYSTDWWIMWICDASIYSLMVRYMQSTHNCWQFFKIRQHLLRTRFDAFI